MEEGLPPKILEKEELQIYILSELFSLPEATLLTFQGGTCLRLIYNGVRYSEDLDFVTTARPQDIKNIYTNLSRSLPRLEPLFESKLKLVEQKESKTFYRFKVHNQKTSPPESFFVSLEFACYPAYTLNIAPLKPQKELPGLPPVLVRAESLEEILADKLCAIGGRKFCKGRDIFDLWLLKQKNILLKPELLAKKLKDYSVSINDLKKGLALASIENVKSEMERFLPLKYRRQFESDNYQVVLSEAKTLIEKGIKSL